MENIVNRIVGVKINRKLYTHTLFYFLHRYQVGTIVGVILLFVGQLSLLYPGKYLDILFVLLAILLFIETVAKKLKYPHGNDLDNLFNKKFYRITRNISFIIIVLL